MGFKSKYYKSRSRPKHLDPKCLTFSLFTANDVRNLSVTQIMTSLCFNILGHPIKGGLYDPALGPLTGDSEPCGTCGDNVFKCPGHFGHIELPVSVVNPLFHRRLFMLLKLSCLHCFTFQVPPYVKLLLAGKLKLLYKAQLSDIDGLNEEVRSAVADSQNAHSEVQTDYIRGIIETYVQNVFNRSRFSQTTLEEEDDNKTNTKNVNIQWHVYIENVLKQYTAGKICINCQEVIPKVSMLQNKIMTSKLCSIKDTEQEAEAETETEVEAEAKEKEKTAAMSRQVIHKLETVMIMADQSKEYLRQLWRNERDLFKIIVPCLDSVDIEYPTDVFFLEAIPVLPPNVRPVDMVHSEIIEHPQTQVYKSIMQDCLLLKNIIQTIQDGSTEHLPEEGRLVFEQVRGHTALEKLHNAWQMLQINVDHLIDREMSKTSESNHCQGLKQIIEKKEGIIRMHMMGKRVNFAARSVITPDPNLNIDEIGVPEAFALKLTYPVPVTPWNVVQLRQLVLNGPNVHPGAIMVENEDGLIQAISGSDLTKRQAIAKRLLTPGDGRNNFFNGIKVIYRHLRNGDVLLVNRQPTLHRPSIMAHKARILKDEKTLRLHYANCKAYNADFDGDETNIHFPQNELARSEGYNLANVSNQYLVPKDGTPLSGLIQDHIVSGVRLTTRGRFFSRSDYMQLVYIALSMKRGDITLLPPAIVKPVPQWSGKQIVSTVIINIIPPHKTRINLTSGTKISMKEWQVDEPRRWKHGEKFKDPKSMSEAEVIIQRGELLCGVLDKTHCGSTLYSLIHCIYELYGGTCASQMLSAFGKLFQAFLQWDGFTLGIEDILVERKADKKRKEIISNSQKIGEDIQKAVLEVADDMPADQVRAMMEESYWSNPKFRMQLDRRYKSTLDVYTNDINKTCLPAGLFKRFPDNNLQLMVQSGAKGSTVNAMQISCSLGQIELEGKRPPLMISGKSLPSFLPYDPTPRAGGFIAGRFMTGIKPQEFFFHCMAGREGLIDTAVKTSRSGYLQRCLIKHLEGLVVGYDSTVRDSDGSLIQWYYGEDGLDISGSRFLNKEQMVFLIDNRDAIIDAELLEHLQTESDSKKIAKMAKKIKKWESKNGSCLQKRRISEFSRFSMDNAVQTNSVKAKSIDSYSGRSKATLSLLRKWIRITEEVKNAYHAQCVRCPDPVMSVYKQDIEFGVLSERLESLLDEYNLSRARMSCIGKSDLRNLLSMKVMKIICPPGEPVGLLAAQSIGEPSTQMTLNTFHHAGRGEMNVTLGIPRLREILMMASKNIKTPSMEIPFRKDYPGNLVRRSNELKLKLTKCVLSDILENITVSRRIEQAPRRRLVHTITIEFLLRKYYKSEFCVRLRDAIKRTEEIFFKNMFKEIKKAAKVTGVLLHFEEDHNKKRINDEDTLDEVDPDEERSAEEHSGVEGREGRREGGMRKDLGETHESSDEEEAAEDADATMSRSISRHRENQEYEDLEDEDEMENVTNNGEEGVRNNSANRASRNQDDDDDDDDDDDAREEVDKNLYSDRRNDIVNMYRNALEYDYDEKKFSWCKFTFWLPLGMIKLDLPTIIKNVANKTVLWETPCIKKAFVFQNNENETILKTDGLNIVEMFKYNDILDLNRLYSNDIYNICQTYGIEAGNRVIKKEVKDVFKMYGITVDYRHLSLIADYMTFSGQFQPFNRKGMEDSASPLQQMSFESSLNFLKSAALRGKRDDLFSPSSRLMLGQPCKSGTGACSILIKLQK